MGNKKTFRNLLLFGSATVGIMHCINSLIYQNANSEISQPESNKKHYNSRFGRILYRTYGTGSPLLLIHDLDVCSSSYEWNQIIPKLEESHTIYALDLPGCGFSDKSNLIYTNHLYMQLIHDFIKDIVKEPVDIVSTGHSSGFTVMTCSQEDSMINQVILVNPETGISPLKSCRKYIDLIKYLFTIPVIGRFAYNVCVNKDKIADKFQQRYFYDKQKVSENMIMTYYESSQKEKTHGKQLYSSLLCGFLDYNISDILKKAENKIYIIIGSSDIDNINNAEQYQNLRPEIEIKKIEHTKYLPQLEKPEGFVTTLKELL